MLNLTYFQEGFAYKEICRRLTRKDSLDWEVKRFQNECLAEGIDQKWLDSNRWEIEVVRVLGGGNLQQEQAQAQAMLNIRPMLNPEAQQEVLNDYVFAVTHDPKRAARLAPIEGQTAVTDSIHDTEIVFGSLMGGAKVTPRPTLIPMEVVQTMLAEMGSTVKTILQTGGVGTPDQVIGLRNCERYAGFYLQQMAQDQTVGPQTKQLADALKNIMNQVKAMEQRQQQAAKAAAQQQQDNSAQLAQQEMMVKLQGQQAHDQQKLQSKAAADQQKLASKERAEQQKLAHKQVAAQTDLEIQQAKTAADVQNASMIAGAKASAAATKPEKKAKK